MPAVHLFSNRSRQDLQGDREQQVLLLHQHAYKPQYCVHQLTRHVQGVPHFITAFSVQLCSNTPTRQTAAEPASNVIGFKN